MPRRRSFGVCDLDRTRGGASTSPQGPVPPSPSHRRAPPPPESGTCPRRRATPDISGRRRRSSATRSSVEGRTGRRLIIFSWGASRSRVNGRFSHLRRWVDVGGTARGTKSLSRPLVRIVGAASQMSFVHRSARCQAMSSRGSREAARPADLIDAREPEAGGDASMQLGVGIDDARCDRPAPFPAGPEQPSRHPRLDRVVGGRDLVGLRPSAPGQPCPSTVETASSAMSATPCGTPAGSRRRPPSSSRRRAG